MKENFSPEVRINYQDYLTVVENLDKIVTLNCEEFLHMKRLAWESSRLLQKDPESDT